MTDSIVEKNQDICAVILCGGSGTRLWPVSRRLYPKQFHAIHGERPLLGATAARLAALEPTPEVMALCAEEFRFLVSSQLQSAGVSNPRLVLEPAPKNTAPAVAAAATLALRDGRDPVLVVLPSDHLIQDNESFCRSIRRGIALALDGNLVTFGVRPDKVETGFGYIVGGKALHEKAWRVARFIEKPPLEQATALVEAGDAFWNSGVFTFKASRYIEELEKFRPEIVESSRRAVEDARQENDCFVLDSVAWETSPVDSIDYAVMEHTEMAALTPMDSDWSDIGSWQGVWESANRDGQGNAGEGNTRFHQSSNNLVWGSGRLVVASHVNDLVIVDSDDALLVTDRHHTQEVKEVVEALRHADREEADLHLTVYRPWGSFTRIDGGDGFQVKRLVVNPGASISLQRHQHRSEHWVVVRGVARVTRGDDLLLLNPGQSVYIPVTTIHRLENPGDEPLEVVEVQTGDYLGEDDIERFEDQYGREGTATT